MSDFTNITDRLELVTGGTYNSPQAKARAEQLAAKMPAGRRSIYDACDDVKPLVPFTQDDESYLNWVCPNASARGQRRGSTM